MIRSEHGIKIYMQDIERFPLIGLDEEAELAKGISEGSQAAMSKLIESNLRLVVKIAHDFKGLGLPLLDLISEGNIGLMRAAEKFDPQKGAKFSSYSAWWIKQAMRRALANQSRTIRVPVQSAAKMNRIRAERGHLAMELGREPTTREIARTLQMSERTVANLRKLESTWISLQEPIQEGEASEIEQLIPDTSAPTPDVQVAEKDTSEYLIHLIENLEDRESAVLRMRFGLDGAPPKTLEQVSNSVGRTRERIRQIQNRALAKLRRWMSEDRQQSLANAPDVGEGVSGKI